MAFNDIDFCLRLRDAGWQIVWTPHAELTHHESASRGFDDTSAKQVRLTPKSTSCKSAGARARSGILTTILTSPSAAKSISSSPFRRAWTKPWKDA